jgi:hypothetical protein
MISFPVLVKQQISVLCRSFSWYDIFPDLILRYLLITKKEKNPKRKKEKNPKRKKNYQCPFFP